MSLSDDQLQRIIDTAQAAEQAGERVLYESMPRSYSDEAQTKYQQWVGPTVGREIAEEVLRLRGEVVDLTQDVEALRVTLLIAEERI